MSEAKNYQEFIVESDAAVKKTVDELGLRAGSDEKRLFDDFVHNVEASNKLKFQGDVKSRHEAAALENTFNPAFYAKLDEMRAMGHRTGNLDLISTANTADEATRHYSAQIRGPSIVDRVTVEPYYNQKEKTWKPEGLLALAGGLGVGALLANSIGFLSEGFTLTGALQAIGVTLLTGLAVGGLLPPAINWVSEQISGKKTPPAPSQGQEQSQSQSQTPAKQQSTGINHDKGHYASTDQMPAHARQAATHAARPSVTILGGPGNGQQLNVDRSQPIMYGANYYSPTGIPRPYYNSAAYGAYGYDALPASGYRGINFGQPGVGTGYANNLNYANNGYGGYGGYAGNAGYGGGYGGYGGYNNIGYTNGNGYGFGALPRSGYYGVGGGVPNSGYYGSTMINPYGGINAGVTGPFGLNGGVRPTNVGIPGYDMSTEYKRHVGGFAFDESKSMHFSGAPLSGFNPNAFNPLATDSYPQTPNTPNQHQHHRRR